MQTQDVPSGSRPTAFGTFNRVINAICLVLMLVVMGTVIYGLLLRAQWEQSYYLAVAIAVLGAIAILIGLAQQEIAARDKATWRAMAEWQIRATYERLAAARGEAGTTAGGQTEVSPSTIQSEKYHAQLIEVLIEDMQRITSGPGRP